MSARGTIGLDRPSRRCLAPLAGMLWCLGFCGCGGDEATLDEIVARCAELPGATASENDDLRGAVERIEALGQTPNGLVRPAFDDDENAATLLAAALSDATRLRLYPKLRDLIPEDRYDFHPAEISKITTLLNGAMLVRQQIERAGEAPSCHFEVRYDYGYFGKMRMLDDVAIACRLHLLAAAPPLAEGDIATALGELAAAMRWIDRLAEIERLESRLRASALRHEAFKLVATLAAVDNPQQADLEFMYALVRRSLETWPEPAGPLVGDRALTMHSYEAIRLGLLDKLITAEEKELWKEQGLVLRFQNLTKAQVDLDELAYLRAMQKLIEASPRPYYLRAGLIADTMAGFDPEGAGGADAPLASYLFMPGLADAMLEISRDRAACESWALALASAGGIDLPEYQTNPTTGVDYEIDRLDGTLVVRTGDPGLPDPYATSVE